MNESTTQNTIGDQLLRIKAVSEQTTLSKSCINLWVAQEKFPRPIILSNTVKVWRQSHINEWLQKVEDQ